MTIVTYDCDCGKGKGMFGPERTTEKEELNFLKYYILQGLVMIINVPRRNVFVF